MRTKIQTYTAFIILAMMSFQILLPTHVVAGSNSDELVYPLKEISKLECRFEEFDSLSSNCKQALPVLKSKDYNKYAKQNGGYNDFTRIYTVLWGASYKYGWDVGSGGHQGTDIATAKGTPVYSMADGKVIESGSDVAWGKYISIEHTIKGKKVVSNYAHLSKILVTKGEKVDAGENIGEVGSTGNSTGNHLHFQIDLPNLFHPYYYDWNACPYSYYEITEKGVCFDELAKNTFDPISFLESNGAILDKVTVTKVTTTSKNTSTQSSTSSDVFNILVSPEHTASSDVKKVQQLYKDLGYYKGSISGKYSDLEESLIDYQVARNVISSRTADGAGWFGPKTRAQTKADYTAYLAKADTSTTSETTETQTATVEQKIEKVSREQLLTREEIEAREVQDFLKSYDLSFKNAITHLDTNDTKVTTLTVKNSKGRGFKGNTPGHVSFEFDESKISVFPKSFYNFSDGTRDISITGKSSGHTTLSVKIGDVIVKSFSISVGKPGQARTIEAATIYTDTQTVLADENTAIVLMKDQYGNKLVRADYAGEFKISSDDDVLYCIKRGSISDIKHIYARSCYDEEYTDNLSFKYEDTIGGLLVFDYKVLDTSQAKLKVENVTKRKDLASITVKTQTPKGLTASHEYFPEIIQTLSSGITSGINNGYFLENRELSEYDAQLWVKNTIIKADNSDKEEKLKLLKFEARSKTKKITREDFLKLAHDYLGNTGTGFATRAYRDLEEGNEVLVASLLGDDFQWQDNFGENYFQPDKKITRGEAAYMLTQALEKNGQSYLVRR